MSASPSSGIEFGPFRLDPAKRLLYRNNQLLPLRPKVVDVLVMLVEREGDLVEKEELIRRVWPDVAVEESNLPTTVSALRRTLGDGYIETVPRRGYRFAASIREPDAAGYTAKPVKRPVRFWIAGAIVLVGVMVAAWRLPSLRNNPVEAAWKTEPLTTLEDAEDSRPSHRTPRESYFSGRVAPPIVVISM
jgi:DNA-binding winged helix-turn-helix (wHTH) protein